jgi:hypothetical protein
MQLGIESVSRREKEMPVFQDQYVSSDTEDFFDAVVNDDYIYESPNCPDRWPDSGNDGYDYPGMPPIKYVSMSRTFIASQPEVSPSTVARYARNLAFGAKMPPVAAIKCKDGIIVWNGHHRFCAHRLAGKKTIPVRFWAEFNENIIEYSRQMSGI